MKTHTIKAKNSHPFILNTANSTRDKITAQQMEDIQRLYNKALKDTQKELKQLKNLQTASASLQTARLKQLQKALNKNLDIVQSQLKSLVTGNMKAVSSAVVDDTKNWLEKVGLKATTAFASVPDDVVRSLSTGQVYQGDWNLSKAIWSNNKKAQHDIQQVIAQGTAENKSAYEIAQDLEKYVDPKAAKSWEWNKVYPGTAARIDYNAQRLARTMVSHAYAQSTIITSKQNPFCEGIKWHSSDSVRTCNICAARDGEVFATNDCPLDHPNGMCTLEPYIPDSFDAIGNRIGAWMNGESDSELDDYADSLGYKLTDESTAKKLTKATKSRIVRNKITHNSKVIKDIDWKNKEENSKWIEDNFKPLADSIRQNYSEETWNTIKKSIRNRSPQTQKWLQTGMNNFKSMSESKKVGSYYSKGNIFYKKAEDMGMDTVCKPLSAFYHEYGHLLDDGLNDISSDSKFIKAMKNDYSRLTHNSNELSPMDTLNILSTNNSAGVQDFISGMSDNKIEVKWCHPSKYWNSAGVKNRMKMVSSEVFANANAALCNPTLEEYFKRYLPETYNYFLGVVTKVVG